MRVYIASPYTFGNREENVRRQIDAAEILMNNGLYPYAPLLNHYHELVYHHSYDSWLSHDIAWLSKCDVLLRLGGDSIGADHEIGYALSVGIPVYYSIEELLNGLSEGI